MGGRAAIILVVSLSFILGYIGMNMNRYATDAVGNMASYYDATGSHNLALAGANIGLSKFYEDTTWFGTINQTFDIPSMKGSFTVKMVDLGSNKAMLRSVSTYRTWYASTLHDTVEVYFDKTRFNSLTMYAWMTDFEGNSFWVTGDTAWGRVHSNGNFHISGTPVFMDKATTSKQFDPKPGVGQNKAIYKKGYETGVASITFPSDINEIIAASTSGGRSYAGDISVTLYPGTSANNDGYAIVQSGATTDTILLSGAFNGVILGGGRVDVKGTLDGKLTIASTQDLYIQDDIVYEHNPMAGASDDLLGLVAGKNVVVAQNAANNSDCVIDAAIFAKDVAFTAENVNNGAPRGDLQVLGSIIQKERGLVATYAGNSVKTGYYKRFRYDTRLEDPAFRPPYFPGYYVKTYDITNWWESYRISEVQ